MKQIVALRSISALEYKVYKEKRRFDAESSIKDLIYRTIKRCFDLISSLLVSMILIAPLMALCICVAIKDFGNPFYMHKRVGKNNTEFRMLKLRSMKKGSDDVEHTLCAEQLEKYRQEYKLEDDPRLIGWEKEGDGRTCFGAWLRRTSLDELPQIMWNILLKGNMSVVGPRPILREELEQHYTPDERELLLSVKPGLTGYWQAYARNNATYESGERQRMELFYVKNRNIWFDIKIVLVTIGAVLRKCGAK